MFQPETEFVYQVLTIDHATGGDRTICTWARMRPDGSVDILRSEIVDPPSQVIRWPESIWEPPVIALPHLPRAES